MRHLAQLASSVVTLTMLASSVSVAQQPKFSVLACSDVYGKFDAQTRDIAKCGTVTVPQDRTAPNSTRLQHVVLPVIEYAAKGAHGTPVLFLAGGPGESAIDAAQQALFQTPFGQLLLRERPLITYDRRGVWVESHRASPELGSVRYEARYPRSVAVNSLRDTIDRVSRELHTRGVEPKNFTTLAAVDDIADVIHALGYNKVVIFGASYGTREALHFARKHPEMGSDRRSDQILAGGGARRPHPAGARRL